MATRHAEVHAEPNGASGTAPLADEAEAPLTVGDDPAAHPPADDPAGARAA